ncbi:MAG: hypothetical protein L3K06_07150 [Thermoplasmata archaeon]|nr:hypothetical protein [Thermoplasmata archaeon]
MRLLGVLLSVGLVLGLTVYVIDRVNAQEQKTSEKVGVRLLPGGIVVPDSDSPVVAGGGAVDSAQTVACATTSQSLRTAEDTYQAVNNHYADLPTLIAAGTIRKPSKNLYTIASTDGFVSYHLVGQNGCP